MRNKTLALLLVALLALVGWALHQRFELVTETVDLGPGELARRDPLLAARRFLEALGARTGARDRLPRDAELRDEGTLIVGEAGEVLTAGQAQQLLDWVAAGGHLIVAASAADEDEPTPLLAPFGVVRREVARPPGTPASPDVAARLAELLESAGGAPSGKTEDAPRDELTELAFDGEAARPRVHFDPRYILAELGGGDSDEDVDDSGPRRTYAAGSAAGAHFAQYEWGNGVVSVMSDLRPWHNERIGLYDHALLLRILVDAERPVLVLHGARMPDLVELIGRHGREPLLAAALCLLAWLLHRTHRFGPLRADEEGVRRALGEHILAAGRYRWRHAGGHAVLRGARDAVLERARRRLPDLPHGDAQAAALEEHTGLPAEDIRQALLIDPGRDAAALQAAASRLQSLWKRL